MPQNAQIPDALCSSVKSVSKKFLSVGSVPLAHCGLLSNHLMQVTLECFPIHATIKTETGARDIVEKYGGLKNWYGDF